MTFAYKLGFCVIFTVLLAACTTTVEQGINKEVEFISAPAGAQVMVSSGPETCKTPCALNIGSKLSFKATFRLDGYKEAVVDVVSRSSENSAAILAGSAPPRRDSCPGHPISARPFLTP